MKDLLPTGAVSGDIHAVVGGDEAGSVQLSGSPTGVFHAAVWMGSAATFKDKNPSGYQFSSIDAIVGNGFVGAGIPNGVTLASGFNPYQLHALRWTGSGVVDLHPAGKLASEATAGDGNVQVGDYFLSKAEGLSHACLWRGSAKSFVDLQQSLPGIYPFSKATSVVGNKVYGYAFDSSLFNFVAVVWTVS
jgi:hypothetical protein